MEIIFQLLDCDYIQLNGSPVIRLFGKTKDGKTVCGFLKNYFPYFYVIPKGDLKENLKNFSQLIVKIEETEKFLPIGFQSKKTKLTKITVSDPSRVPEIRDWIKDRNLAEEIFEADILFKYRFMADFNIFGMRWYKISGHNINTTTVRAEKNIEVEKIEEVSDSDIAPLKYLSIDIEVAAGETLPDPKKDPIAMISLSFSPQFEGRESLVLVAKPIKMKDAIGFRSEKEMLEEFVKIIEKFDPDVITGYNINNFDLPYIAERLRQCKINLAIGRCAYKPMATRKITQKFRNSITGRIIADVYEIIKEVTEKGQAKIFKLKRYGLGDVAKEVLNESKLDLMRSEITKYWDGTEEQIQKLVEYCRKDSVLALRLLLEKSLLDKFIEIARITGLLLQDALESGETARIENILIREFNKQDYVLPLKPTSKEILLRKEEREAKGLKGALVLEPEIGLHKNIVYLDFKAMYPSIFIAFNICPTTLLIGNGNENLEFITTPSGAKFVSKNVREGIIPKIVRHLINERDRIKKAMSIAANEYERKILDAKQDALKIVANSFYGQTGYVRSRLYVLDIANAITSCGRSLIQQTKKIVESDPRFKVIYGDTDSIMVKTPSDDLDKIFEFGKEIEEKVNSALKGIVQMKIDSIFKTLLILSKKRYAGLKVEKLNGQYQEKVIMRGIETVRRDWCDLSSETLMNVIEIILKEGNSKKAFDYVRNVLQDLEKGNIPLEKLVITKSISKSLKEYKGVQPHIELWKKLRKRSPATAPGIGDRIAFVIIKGPQLMSERAEDPEYVKAHGLKIDSQYYIESQVLPPLERVFEALKISKSELLGIGKQVVLTDIVKNMKQKEMEKREITVDFVDKFACSRCSQTYRRIPLSGSCECGGEIIFFSNGPKSN